MLRVFSHYVSARTLLLVALEALVLLLAVRAGLSVRLGGSATLAAGSEGAIAHATALALGMLVVINSMGLYQLDNKADGAPSVWVRLIAEVQVLRYVLALLPFLMAPLMFSNLAMPVMEAPALMLMVPVGETVRPVGPYTSAKVSGFAGESASVALACAV